MKKKLFTLLFALFAIATTAQAQVVLNETNFPDANFRAALVKRFGISEGDEITEAKIAAETSLWVGERSIADLTGIEHFTALKVLVCDNNQLTSLDVSKNTALTELVCYSNQLTSLNVSGCTALTDLHCNNNQLTSLDVSGCTALKKLVCINNQLTSLDVSQNTALTTLRCDDNQLTSLDVSGCTALTKLYCGSNQIKGEAMDALVASLPTVESGEFYVINTKNANEGNVCTKAQVAVAKGKGWTVYDYVYYYSYDESWVTYSYYEGKLLLNAENFPDANFRAALASILGISEGDEITEAKIAATTRLYVTGKSIADLTGIEHFTALTWLVCYNNQLTSLDVSKNIALTMLDCHSNQLTSLDVSGCTALTTLRCNYNQLTTLDVSGCTELTQLICNSNQLTSLDVSQNTALTGLVCHDNQLTSLDVSNNTALTTLYCYNNQIKGEAMDALVASLPTVESGNFSVIGMKDANEGNVCTKAQVAIAKEKGWTVYFNNGNNYKEYEGSDPNIKSVVLDAENFPDANFRAALAKILGISEGDEITSVRISVTHLLRVSSKKIADLTGIEHFTALTELYCDNNQLTSLDVSKNTALTELNCWGNQLTSVNVSKNAALTWLNCGNNQLTSLDVSQNTLLEYLSCRDNQLSSLNILENTALTELYCQNNQLTSLDVSKNTALTELWCYNNQIKGEAMDALVASLLTVESGYFSVIGMKDANGGNVCTKAQVAIAKEKGWTVYFNNGNNNKEYEGSDPNIKSVVLDAENFPDANFRAALVSIFGISEGDDITSVRISVTHLLYVSNKKIADLTGIEHFTALKTLHCFNNQLTALDVSKNTALTELNCHSNQLTSLDVSKNTALTDLVCYNNQLTSLDMSNNTALTELNCYSNQLTSLDVSKNSALTRLECRNNQLASLDVSKNTALTYLVCYNNQLTSLDVSQNTALTYLVCYNNQLTALDVSKNTALTRLSCYSNQLTSLDVSKNTALTYLSCSSNQIKGEAMDALVASLPTVESGVFYVIDTKDENEGNVCTKSQVAIAKEKGWWVYDNNGGSGQKYEGSDPVEEDIDPVDEDDNIDFGSDIDENSDLDGNVIGDIFYNIGNGNGEYNAEEGCIVLKKTTDDETVDGLSGKDIFGEDFKGQFTGIVFKVPSGKGTVKVTAETTGNMLLKVKIGDGEPVEMELNGKLKISFPYNVSETTLVAIYAGSNNEAKGFGTTNATEDAALKIYGIEFERGESTAIGASLNDNGQRTNDSWYTIDGVKLNGEPTKKGIYIRNGNKVVK